MQCLWDRFAQWLLLCSPPGATRALRNMDTYNQKQEMTALPDSFSPPLSLFLSALLLQAVSAKSLISSVQKYWHQHCSCPLPSLQDEQCCCLELTDKEVKALCLGDLRLPLKTQTQLCGCLQRPARSGWPICKSAASLRCTSMQHRRWHGTKVGHLRCNGDCISNTTAVDSLTAAL